MSEITKGTLKQFSVRESKNGRAYITLMVDDVFAFWWGKEEDLGVTKDNENDEVEYEVVEGEKGLEAKNVTITKKAPYQPRNRRNNY